MDKITKDELILELSAQDNPLDINLEIIKLLKQIEFNTRVK